MVGLHLRMLDIVDCIRHTAFHDTGQTVLYILGRQSRVSQDHTDIAGILIEGKMSSGVCMMATLRLKIRRDTTMNVRVG